MKLALGVAIVALVGACEKEAAPDGPVVELRLPRSVKKVGQREGKVQDMKMVMSIEQGRSQTVKVESTKQTRETREILEVDADGVATKVKVGYPEYVERQKIGSGEKTSPQLIAGKTYVVWRAGNRIEATREDGGWLPADELQKVIDENRRLGTADPFDELVASKTWKTGQKVVFTRDELARVNVPRSAMNAKPDRETMTAAELTLRRIDDGIARFDVKLGFELTSSKGTMKMTINGFARVATATSEMQEISGSGPVEGDMGAPFTGTVTSRVVAD